jgi:hypothetical protein
MALPKYNPVGHFAATSNRALSKVALMWAMQDEISAREDLACKKVSRSAPKKKPRQLGSNQE